MRLRTNTERWDVRFPVGKVRDGFYTKACPWLERDRAGAETQAGPRNGGT